MPKKQRNYKYTNLFLHVPITTIKKQKIYITIFHFADAGLSDNTSPTHFQALTNAPQHQQSKNLVTNNKKSSPKSLPSATYCASTRSAAVMALALRSQTPPSPQTTTHNKNSRNYLTNESINQSAESTFTTTSSLPSTPPSAARQQQQHQANRSPAQQLKSKILNERPNGIGDLYSGGSSSSDNDGVNTSSSSSATALRRLYFKSGRSTKTKANNANKSSMSMTQITKNAICTAAVLYHSSVEGTLGGAGNTSKSKNVPKVSPFKTNKYIYTFVFKLLLRHKV